MCSSHHSLLLLDTPPPPPVPVVCLFSYITTAPVPFLLQVLCTFVTCGRHLLRDMSFSLGGGVVIAAGILLLTQKKSTKELRNEDVEEDNAASGLVDGVGPSATGILRATSLAKTHMKPSLDMRGAGECSGCPFGILTEPQLFVFHCLVCFSPEFSPALSPMFSLFAIQVGHGRD